jgi:DNA-binding MarR family transcriptional regulator
MNPELNILKALRDIHPRMMNTGSLWSTVRMEEDLLTHSAFTQAINKLEQKEQVVVIQGEDVRRAKITAAGLARLAEAGI